MVVTSFIWPNVASKSSWDCAQDDASLNCRLNGMHAPTYAHANAQNFLTKAKVHKYVLYIQSCSMSAPP
eukprot:5587758-Amphidinium_carterae.1